MNAKARLDGSSPSTSDQPEPIAVIGMACRFPGASSVQALWELLIAERSAITEVPSDRFRLEDWYHPSSAARGKFNSRFGGFLSDVDQFDPYFFGISPREAEHMDPQQRLALRLTWEALEDAQLRPHTLQGSRTGVFLGAAWNDYLQLMFGDPKSLGLYSATGVDFGVPAGRVSYAFGFRGPSFVVSTGCSSSLVAVHLACESLTRGESSLAVAGGVHLMLSPETMVALNKFGGICPDGACKAFDVRANGFAPSDGIGIAVLKRLSDAERDGDPIYCTILGTAVNNDGPARAMTAPTQDGQTMVLRDAYARAGVDPAHVHYVEAHGTGTAAGDPIEARALGAVFSPGRTRPLHIGSVKTNLGHTQTAAGMAGLIKTALSLKSRYLPKSLHFETPNPAIAFEELKLQVQAQAGQWPCPDEIGLAGVSSFGWGATNAHAVLREYRAPQGAGAAGKRSAADGAGGAPETPKKTPKRTTEKAPALPLVLPLSARSERSLRKTATSYGELLASPGERSLGDIAYTAGARRTHHEHRLGVVASSAAQVAEALAAFEQGRSHPAVVSGRAAGVERPRVVFVFPGQGSQWCGMGRELLASEPVFAEALRACDAAIGKFAGWSLLEQLGRDDRWLEEQRLDVVQPALFAIEVALAALWRSWGVEPDVVVGHSMGEVAAAYTAGALSLEDAARVICSRSQLALPLTGQGIMASIELSQEEVERELRGLEDRVSIAVSNSPRSTAISGETQAVEAVLARLTTREVFCRKVKVDFASHSPQVEVLRPALLDRLAPLRPRSGSVALHSTVTCAPIDGAKLDAAYWFRNLRDPVQFARAISELAGAGHSLFIEISPHPILVPAMETSLGEGGAIAVGSLRREQPEREALLVGLARMFCHGLEPRWEVFSPGARAVALPPYAWDDERYWVAARDGAAGGQRRSAGGHPLLGPAVSSSRQAGTTLWELPLAVEDVPYLRDHKVESATLLPATGFIEIGLAGLRDRRLAGPLELEQIELREALALPQTGSVPVQLVAVEHGRGAFSLSVASGDSASGTWTTHATARGRALDAEVVAPVLELGALRARLTEALDGAAFYAAMTASGLDYGPAFQAVQRAQRGERESLVRLEVPEITGSIAAPYVVHPVTLDAAMQSVIGLLGVSDAPVVPVAIERLRVYGALSGPGWGHAVLRGAGDEPGGAAGGAMIADVELLDDAGVVLVELRGLALHRLTRTAAAERPLPLLVQRWRAAERVVPAAGAPSEVPVGRWLVLGDRAGLGGAVAEALRARGGEAIELNDAVSDPDAFHEVLGAGFGPERRCRGIVHAWGLTGEADRRSVDALERAGQRAILSTVALVQALGRAGWSEMPRLWVITQGAQWVEAPDAVEAPEQGMLWGLVRTLRYEHVELRGSVVDLAAGPVQAADVAALVDELCADQPEDELALRGARRYVARLGAVADGELPEVLAPAGDRPYRTRVDQPGTIDAITWRELSRRAPAAGEVEVEIEASALNFRDVLIALGAIEQGALREVGFEHAGRIARLGAGVSGLEVGQPVIAVSTDGTLGTHATTSAALVFPRPSSLSAAEAAGLSLAPGTAYYALAHVARLARGERVLIHAAAGGVGLTAIQWAQHVGAEVFATVGSEAKRELLQSMGVRHISDSRSLRFFDDVMRWTDGEGVDVVLNSLSGELLTKSLELLREEGRFIELGRRDYEADAALGMRPFLRSLTMSLIELRQMMSRRPQRWRAVMLELLGHVEAGVIRPLPTQVFARGQVREAFACLAQSKHIGKIAIAPADRALPIRPRQPEVRIRRDATYLVTGGLGGLGLSVARWLAERGAGRLVLLGRRGAETAAQREAVAELSALGAAVLVAAADVADEAALAGVLRQVDAEGPALAGVIHAAGVLDDGLIVNQDAAKLGRVMGPKVRGAWNLHRLTAARSLDFFVMYSSAASLLGSPGQANYAAANAFMDSLAQHRQARGLPGLAINWGPFSEVGLAAAQDNRGNRIGERGLASFSPARGLELLEHALGLATAQLGAVDVDWRRWTTSYPQVAGSARLSGVVVHDERGGGASLAETVRRAAVGARHGLIEAFVRDQVIAVLRLDPGRVTAEVPFKAFGIDSLTGLELRNRLERGLGLGSLPATIIWTYPTISALTAHLIGLVMTADPGAAAAVDDAIAPRPADARLELLPVQRRLWELASTTGGNLAYSAIFGLELEGALDRDALTWSAGELTRRQGALRFRIDDRGDGAVGAIAPWQAPEVHVVELPDRAALEVWLRREGERTFDLVQEPPFQLYLLQLERGRQVLCVRVHFISTGGSLSLLLKELVELYNARLARQAPVRPPLAVEFADYMVWYHRKLAAGAYDAQLARWTSALRGAAQRDPLPIDRPRPPAPTHAGRSLFHMYSPAVAAALRQFTEAQDVTKFAALLAGLCALLHRQTGADDVVIGTPIATRPKAGLDDVIGNFVNTLALRVRVRGQDSFAALAQQAKQVSLAAFSDVEAPFEHVEQKLRDDGIGPAAGLPLVQITLAMMGVQEEAASAGFTGVKQVGVVRHVAAAKFDLSILLAEHAAGLMVELEYATELFDEAPIRQLLTRYGHVLEVALANPNVALDNLAL